MRPAGEQPVARDHVDGDRDEQVDSQRERFPSLGSSSWLCSRSSARGCFGPTRRRSTRGSAARSPTSRWPIPRAGRSRSTTTRARRPWCSCSWGSLGAFVWGKAYKLKVWRLPLGTPTSRGKAFVNLFPIEPGETMTSILALPEDEAEWETLDVLFATRSGGVRRNKLSDFVQINRNGKIAMKLDDGDSIIGVRSLHERLRMFCSVLISWVDASGSRSVMCGCLRDAIRPGVRGMLPGWRRQR